MQIEYFKIEDFIDMARGSETLNRTVSPVQVRAMALLCFEKFNLLICGFLGQIIDIIDSFHFDFEV